MGKPKEKTSVAKLEGDVRAHTNSLVDLQGQINVIKGRLDALEVVRVPSPTVEPDYPQRPETE